jgi:hypothetical protein
MNKAAIASLLALAAFAVVPGLVSDNRAAFAQAPAAAGSGQIVMEPAEQADYDNAMNKITAPAQQAPALEAYLAKYPKSGVKNYVLLKIMFDYSQVDPAKALVAADNVIAATPNVLQAYIIEVAVRKGQAEDPKTDAATKQSLLDAAVPYAQKGLPVAQGPKPADVTAEQWAQLTALAIPTFYSTIGEDDLGKKDSAGAITAYKAELAAMKPDQLATPAALQETYYLGQAYYIATPPDYLNCAFYTTRAAALAPAQFQSQLQPLATYCYKKYHGGADGYEALVALAKANPDPPADLATTVKPAPTDEDIVAQTIASTPDLATLALSDKEFILQHGKQADGDKVFDTIKGKSVEIPDALVISSTPTVLQVAVSDDAVQSKKADFTFNLKPIEEPKEKGSSPAAKAAYAREKKAYDKQMADVAAATAVGQKVTLQGTYTSYTAKPIMITMDDGEVILPKAAARTPVRHK